MNTVPTKPRLAISCWLTGRPSDPVAVLDSRSNWGAWNGSSCASSGRFAVQSKTANPIAAIASYGMALRYSYGLVKEADLIDKAIAGALARGFRTGDIMQPNMRKAGTAEMGKAILEEVEKLAAA